MAQVVLFHHVLGQTDGFLAFAEELRRAGHTLTTPDLFGGRVFSTIEQGAAFADGVGFETLMERGELAVDSLPERLVYAGISLGVLPAQRLAQTRPGAQGALLLEGCVPPSSFGTNWPPGVPVQIHGMDSDPFFSGEGDIDAARALVELASRSARAELHVYPGNVHLFEDESLASFDPQATKLLLARALGFLEDLQ